jgi:hypothetical protein
MPTSAVYYEPTSQGYEDTLKQRLAQWDQMRREAEDGRRTADDRQRTANGEGLTKDNETGQH